MAFASNAFQLAVHLLRGQWFTLFASFLIMSTNGSGYLFGIYSKDIKSFLGYNQQTLNTLSFFKDLGSNIGIPSGLINEVSPPGVVLSISAAMNLFGYLMIYLAITGRLARPHLWHMCVYITLGANSQSFSNTGVLVTCVKNFPSSRGVVIGLLKGFIGLSGAIFTQLYFTFYGDDNSNSNSKSLVLLVAWLPSVVCLIFVPTIRIMKVVHQPNEFRVFCRFLYISLALAGYLMVAIILEKKLSFSHQEYSASTTVVLFLLFLPVVIVVREEIKIWKQKKKPLDVSPPIAITIDKEATPHEQPIAITIDKEATPHEQHHNQELSKKSVLSCFINVFKAPERGEDYSIFQALVSVDMVILLFGTICGIGGLLTAIDNMGQIAESLGYPSRSTGTFISLISIWNYMGRVVAGFTSEILLSKYKLPRPLMFSLVLLLSCVGHLFIAFGVSGSLYFASVIIGFCLGAQNPLLYAIISEVFGLKYYSTLYNVAGLASPLASYVFNVRVAGHLYDREAAKQRHSGNSLMCIGVQCFRLSFIVITGVTLFGAVVMLVLVWRTWNFYRGDIYARFEDAAEGEKAPAATGGVVERGEDERPSL